MPQSGWVALALQAFCQNNDISSYPVSQIAVTYALMQDAGALLAALNGVPASGTASAQGILDSLVASTSAFAQASKHLLAALLVWVVHFS